MQDVKYQESHSNYGVCSWALRKEIKVKKGGHKYGPNPKPRLYVSGIVLMWGFTPMLILEAGRWCHKSSSI